MKRTRALTALLLIGLAATAFANPSTKPSDEWRLHFDGRAHSAGEIHLQLAPLGGTPIDVTVPIAEHTGENDAAKITRDTLRGALDDSLWDIDRDDGEEVEIDARHGAADFVLTVVSNTVDGLKVKTERD